MPNARRKSDMPLDGQIAPRTQPRAALMLAAVSAALVVGGILFALGAQFGGTQSMIDGGYWALGIAVAAVIALWAGLRRGSTVSPVFGGLGIAADTFSAAFFLALAGGIFAVGHDGLAVVIGLGAGCLLLQLVVAPGLAASGTASLPQFFAARYPGRAAGFLCALVTVASMLLLLAAELMAAGLVGARLLGVDFSIAAVVSASAVLACFVVRGSTGAPWVNGVLFPAMLLAVLVPLVVLSVQWYGMPIPQLAYGHALGQVQGIEQTLLEQELADPAVMKPMLTAFVALTPTNFLGIVLGLAAGVAVLPSMLPAQLTAVPAPTARRAALWGLIFVAALLTLMPAIAAYAKLALIQLLADRTPIADLPAWIFTYGKLGLVEICGRAATDAATAAQACAALSDVGATLRLQDISISPDIIVLALPEIAGLPHVTLGLLAAVALAVAITTASGPVSAIVRAFGLDASTIDNARPQASRLCSYGLAGAALVVATIVALARAVTILDLATYAVVLAAVGLFPAVLAALWWKRANTYGAAGAMLVGLGAALLYFVGAHYFAVPLAEASFAFGTAGTETFDYFVELKGAWLAAPAGPAKDVAWTALDGYARGIGPWWGVLDMAIALLAIPAGLVTLVVVSLLTPAPRAASTVP
jgi:cation/acetate symporter